MYQTVTDDLFYSARAEKLLTVLVVLFYTRRPALADERTH